MAYYELTSPGCLHFENSCASLDVKVLGRMANECLTWLETKTPCSNEEKVQNATIAISEIYNDSKDELSEVAKERYFINTVGSKTKHKVKTSQTKN